MTTRATVWRVFFFYTRPVPLRAPHQDNIITRDRPMLGESRHRSLSSGRRRRDHGAHRRETPTTLTRWCTTMMVQCCMKRRGDIRCSG